MAFKFTNELEQKIQSTKKTLDLAQVKMVEESSLVPAAKEGVELGNAIKKLFSDANKHAQEQINELGDEVGKAVDALSEVHQNHQEQLTILEGRTNSLTERVNAVSQGVADVDAKMDQLHTVFNNNDIISPDSIMNTTVCGDTNNPCYSFVNDNN